MSIAPSLVMIPSGYKAQKVYSAVPTNGDGDFDFARSTTATRVNKDGFIETVGVNVPRLDYSDGGCPSLLLEPSSTNLVTYSNDFSNSSWSKQSSSTISTNTVISPDGTLNASTFKASSNSGGVVLSTNIAKTAFIKYSFSFYVKKSNHRYIGLSMGTASTSGSYNFYDFDTDTINNTIVSPQSAPITRELIGNGWVKLTQVFEMEDSAFFNSLTRFAMTNSSGSTTYTPSGTEEVYVYGAQLEQKSYPTSYIPTSGSAVTRVAETANGAGDASTFNDSEGVLYAEISALANDLSFRLITLSDGTTNDRISFGYRSTSNAIYCEIRSANVTQAFLLGTLADIKNLSKVAIKYKENDFALWINGIEAATDNSGITPLNLSRLNFDSGQQTGGFFYGNVKDLRVYNTALTDSELQALTK